MCHFVCVIQGHNGLAASEMLKLLEEEEPKVAIIGPSFSDALTITGQIAAVYNIVQVGQPCVMSD